MNRRTVMLVTVLVVLAGLYGWFVLMPRGGDLKVYAAQRGRQPMTFMFNRPVHFREIKVTRVEPAAEGSEEGGYERVVWHLELDAEAEETHEARDHLRYGQRLKGMRLADGLPRRAERLEAKAQYWLKVRTAEGDELRQAFSPM